MTPEKELLFKEIKQIKDQVNQIYTIEVKEQDIGEGEVQFKNTLIVAWLLNRSEKSLKEERQAFFNRINEELRELTKSPEEATFFNNDVQNSFVPQGGGVQASINFT